MPPDHLAWATTNPLVVYLNSLKPYLPILFSGFNEEEYFSCPTKEDEDIVDGVTKVAEAEAKKELKAKVKRPYEVPYSIVRGLILF